MKTAKTLPLSFDRAQASDVKLVFDWRNDPVSRAAAHNSEPLVWEKHGLWFDAALKNSEREIYIVKHEGIPVASIRRDRHQGHWLISIVVAPEQRGKGIAKALLWQFVRKFSDIHFAEIKPSNIASIKIFSEAGFKLIESLGKYQVWKYIPDEALGG